ncbi:MAG: HAD-IA family hydrolase [Bryobacterales bacterium]|nr:HAD-IA family hydrolase [Bryobacterales bacterium]
MKTMIVFDMDGVLVDVSDSYRETICQTVHFFTGKTITRELVQVYKNRGGFNNDWLLSQTIARDLGVEVEYQTVVDRFNDLFFGDLSTGIPTGLMRHERWLPQGGFLEKLAVHYQLAIFTGRLRDEALITLRRFGHAASFAALIGADDVENGKPHPEGLLKLAAQYPNTNFVYIGDTVDDARSSRAAGVPFVGIAHPHVSQRGVLLDLFRQEQAIAILEDINQLPNALTVAV